MTSPSIGNLLNSSGLVFAGSVAEIGRSALAGFPSNGRTAIVRVNRLLKGPPDLQLESGMQVTVQLAEHLPVLAPGDTAAFFTNGLAYGDTIAVAEVGRIPIEQAPGGPSFAGDAEVSQAIDEAAAELAQNDVLQHARSAATVVRGQVIALSAMARAAAPHEHDPDWWIATLSVDVVAKGSVPDFKAGSGTVNVLYANSIDVRWRDFPKPKASQGGLWILHTADPQLHDLADLQILHRIDLQPSIQLDFLSERGL